MDTSKLKKYAIQARRDFRDAVSARAKRIGVGIGVSAEDIQRYSIQGDLLILGEQVFPKQYKTAFDALYREVHETGFEAVIDELAYTWFNRFVALRFMELHEYFPHGLRVLSSKDSDPTPEILRNPLQLDFTYGFDKKLARELFDAGNNEEELYRLLLIAQCNELHIIMPFLFERVSDLSEILLPDNLLASDSIIRKLVNDLEEDQWHQGVEIIGWIYQYYISEKKDEVIGKVVKSEDIPAATQLFTPNWIVKYLVQNSVGAYWLGTYPESELRSKMEYYIEPAKQEPAVVAELKKITPLEINPETITVLDPASGSGHILVEAYNVLKEIYLERGYRPREIPRLILEKNLFGLDIDTRAAQLASFALLMRARADDSSIFSSDHPVKLNILEIIESDFSVDEAVQALTKGKNVEIKQMAMPFIPEPTQTQLLLNAPGTLSPGELKEFIELFANAKTFGSLITIPKEIQGKIAGITALAEKASRTGDIFEQEYGRRVLKLCEQARVLGGQFDAVVANPPYMGSKFFTPELKTFINCHYPGAKSDLFASFLVRLLQLTNENRFLSAVTMEAWMFLSSYELLRKQMLSSVSINTLTHMPYRGRSPTPMRINFGTSAFAARLHPLPAYAGSYNCLRYFELDEEGIPPIFPVSNERLRACSAEAFEMLPGSPIAYWVSDKMRQVFKEATPLGEIAEPRVGLQTGSNSIFLRLWWEVGQPKIGFGFSSQDAALQSGKKWFPYNKGGDFRKWYGNNQYVVNWENDGFQIRNYAPEGGDIRSRPQNTSYYFKPGITWTFISSSKFGVRLSDVGFIFDVAGSSIFPRPESITVTLGLMLSPITWESLRAQNPTLNFQVGNIASIPVSENAVNAIATAVSDTCIKAVGVARSDWDSLETSWDFQISPLHTAPIKQPILTASYQDYEAYCLAQIKRMQNLEAENNRLFIKAYGLDSELSPEVEEEDITLHRPDRSEDIRALLSYALGCTLGRYSLDTPGLIYANSNNLNFDPSRYKKFPADADGVVPVLDHPWFADDITSRFKEFLLACWDKDSFEENIKFVADSLDPKAGETPEETIRRYFCDDFFNNHLKIYKKRPIYWLFSSGKEKAFQALVYLHRYNEQTLSKMRTDYVLPLQGKMANEEKRLDAQSESASSPAERNRYKKELEKLRKKQAELRKFDELLHHYADKRISLDLDDGVKVNYGQFGALLAEVKQVTGGSEE